MNAAPVFFKTDDKLNLSKFAECLEAFITAERHFVSGSLVLSLNAPFGAGKSMFLQMWRNSLLERRQTDQSLPLPIILNTWESDHCGDPLLALISALSKELTAYKAPKGKIDAVREAAKDVAWFGIGVANSIVSETTGVDAIASGEFAGKKKSERGPIDMLAAFESRNTALQSLKTSLADLFQPGKNRAIFMIDELDRCRPDYAVEFLEAIKHVFDITEVTFILAVDKAQLSSSVRALFGTGIIFDEYYRKFAHRNLSLPAITTEKLPILINHYWQTIITHSELRPAKESYAKFNETALITLQELVACLKLTPRQIHEMFRIFGHLLAKKNQQTGDLFWGHSISAMFMAALAVGAAPLYHSIGNKSSDFENVSNALLGMLANKEYGDWWMHFLISGRAFPVTDLADLLQRAKAKGLLVKTQNADQLREAISSDFGGAWGHSGRSDALQYTYSLIEALRSFGA